MALQPWYPDSEDVRIYTVYIKRVKVADLQVHNTWVVRHYCMIKVKFGLEAVNQWIRIVYEYDCFTMLDKYMCIVATATHTPCREPFPVH